MSGAIVQLVAYGIQDLYLTYDPQITFFKIIYRRHTNFSVESVLQNFTEPADFGKTVTCNLAQVGDLVEKTFLYIQIPAVPKFVDNNGNEDMIKKFAWVRSLGFAIIKEISLEIGGKLIDRQYGEWLYIWSQVSNKQDLGLDKMIGNIPEIYEFSNGKKGYELYIPLNFWFCRYTGLSLPLIALTSSDVKISITFRRLDECLRIGPTHSIEILEDIVPFSNGDYIEQIVNGEKIQGYFIDYDYITKKLYYIKIQNQNATKKTFTSLSQQTASFGIINDITYAPNIPYRIYNPLTGFFCTPRPNITEKIEISNFIYKPKIVNSFLYVNYIYLDTDERLKFARSNHEYLIDQIQFNQDINIKSPNVKQNLSLIHPCKSHYWIAQLDSIIGTGTINDIFNFTDSPLRYPDGRLYGNDLILSASLLLSGRSRFSVRESEYFNYIVPYQCHYRGPIKGINVYSFCLKPEDNQPSSTCNMSKIDTISMEMKLRNVISTINTCRIRSYTLNYNVLRVFFNLGGLAFV